jgi:3-deoxy-D-manno-octulosonate 8-phosphate phosphatase (KDO 8-P phosphatase)
LILVKLSTKALNAKLARVKLFLCDVDGVLTDGAVYIAAEGEMKRFYIPDGLGLHQLQQAGIRVGWISARPSVVTNRRAKELKMDFLSQNKGSKVAAAEAILAETGLSFAEVCFVGDDLFDLALLKRAGVGVSVANGVQEAKAAADYVTKASGGHGAIREIAELILKAQNKWAAVIRRFSA